MALTVGLDHDLLATVLSLPALTAEEDAGTLTEDDVALIVQIKQAGGGGDFGSFLDEFKDLADGIQSLVVTPIDDFLEEENDLLGGIDDKIGDAIAGFLGPIIDAIEQIEGRILSGIQGSISGITSAISSLNQDILQEINRVISGVGDLLRDAEERILAPVLSHISAAIDLINQIDDKVKDVVNMAVAPILLTTSSILDSVQGFATALRDVIPDLGNRLVEGLTAPLEILTDGVKDAASGILGAFFGDIAEDVVERIDPIIQMFEEELSVSPELRKLTAPGALPVLAVGGLIAGFALPMILSSVASTALSPFAEKLRQRMNTLARPTLMSAADAVQGQQKGFITPELSQTILDRQGFPDDQQKALFDIIQLRPGTLDIIDFWRREIFSDEQAETELQNLGWDARYRGILKEAAFPPPGVQDLIRMAVREVFSPEIAEQFGQFEGQPPLYTQWAKKIGLSEEWARNFWAAHWVLPSVQQGFQMLHRGVITEDDLERLFIALDVMPFWRQPIKDIAFRPFTRVDVRRMFALGVLDRSGVLRSYLDLGFAPDKAENMTEFTVRWVESTRKVEKDKERDLTKGDIIGLFNDGLIGETAAKGHLRSMGFDENESELLIQREVMQELRQDRKADIKLIVDQAKIKVLTFSESQDRLNALDLTQKELQRSMIEVTRATTERIRLPSKADLDGWKELNLLSLDQYETELDNLGFPAKYVALYVEAIQLEEADDLLAAEEREARKTEPRPITKGQLDSLLRTEVIDTDEYIEGLGVLRFDESAIDSFVTQITVQIEEIRLADQERAARGEAAAEKEKLLSRVILGKLVLTNIIGMDAYREGLRKLGFSIESVELLATLLLKKLAAAEEGE